MRLPAIHDGSCVAVAMYKTPNLVGDLDERENEKEVLVATSYKDPKTWNRRTKSRLVKEKTR